uniref:DEAD/DEAH box helicase n=1 Tax=Galbibacter sp. TaxID=2918471 RepID=UPI003A95334D
DEIHHCAGQSLNDANAWGEEIILNIQSQAEYTLALTGTPWRSDQAPIVLSHYSDPDNQIQCDYIYGLRDAVTDGVCRSPKIVLIDNEKISVTDEENDTKTFNSLDELFKCSSVPYQSLIEHDFAIRHALTLAISKLKSIRLFTPDAAGLVVASSVEHATYILNILRNEYEQTAEIVTYREKHPNHRINEFRDSETSWIVSVGMISEGTDIPRLQVCCHLSRVRTELYFRQVLGRILRKSRNGAQDAWLYTFAVPKLVEYANRVAEEIPDFSVVLNESVKKDNITQIIARKPYLPHINVEETNSYSLKLEGSDFEKDTLSQFETQNSVAIKSSRSSESMSFELLGGFREKVVSIYSSPF